MTWLRKYWPLLLLVLALLWWLLTGQNPIAAAISILGRGRRLTLITLDDDGAAMEDLDDLVEAASGIMERPIHRDALLLAIMSGSEHASAGQREKAAMQRVALNRVTLSKDIEAVLTSSKGLGKQGPRQFATSRDAYEDDLLIAEANLAGDLADDTAGAMRFVHWTGSGWATGSYQATCDKWYRESGIVPIDIGDVSSLRLFIPEAKAKELGYA